MKYLLDSCCFIEPSRTFCAIDVGLSFWNKISELSRSGQVFSIDKVKKELMAHEDALSTWVKANLDSHFFLGQTEESIAKLREIQDWVSKNSYYTERAKTKYLRLDRVR